MKELSGSGAVYATERGEELSSESSSASDGKPDVKFIKTDPPGRVSK